VIPASIERATSGATPSSRSAQLGKKLVNGFVNETPYNDGDVVERTVMA